MIQQSHSGHIQLPPPKKKKKVIQKDTWNPMFIASLFNCPSTNELLKRYHKYIQWNTTQP